MYAPLFLFIVFSYRKFMKNLDCEFLKAKDIITSARKIVIISHRSPDGDTVGANIALRLALKYQWNKEIISACVDPPPRNSRFLPEVTNYVADFNQESADLIISVDCGAHYMLAFHKTKPNLFSGVPPLINIDHHASNDNYGKVNIVDDTAAAATQIVYYFLKFCGLKITRHIATCLLHGLYFDTGSFMHSNTEPEVLEVASTLVWKGADFKTISRSQFHTMPIQQLKIYGKIFERARVNPRKIALSALTDEDFTAAKATADDTTGAIDYLNSVPESDFCCLLHQEKQGVVKGSFRTRVDTIDLSRLASIFGGGGHKKAAGFSFPGNLIEVKEKIRIGE